MLLKKKLKESDFSDSLRRSKSDLDKPGLLTRKLKGLDWPSKRKKSWNVTGRESSERKRPSTLSEGNSMRKERGNGGDRSLKKRRQEKLKSREFDLKSIFMLRS